MDSIPNLKPSEIQFYLSVLENVRNFGLLKRFDIDVEARLRDVREKIGQVSERWYEENMQDKQAQPGVNRALPLLLMTDEVEKATKGLDKRFPEPLLGCVIISLFSSTCSWINRSLIIENWTLYHYSSLLSFHA